MRRGRAGRAARLAWSLGGLAIIPLLAIPVLGLAGLRLEPALWLASVAILAFPVVGALVAGRQPGNPVGWLLVAVAPCLGTALVGSSLSSTGMARGSAPLAAAGSLLFLPWFAAVVLVAVVLPLYFPTGRLLSKRWRPVLWAGIGFAVLAMVGNGLQPYLDSSGQGTLRNPLLFLPAARPLLQACIGLTVPCALVGFGGTVAALVLRFRRAAGIERQQLEWFCFAAAVTPLPLFVLDLNRDLFVVVFLFMLPLIPVSVGVAILRYRLYEIDRIINRTLVYALLSALLGLGWAAGALVFGLLGGAVADPPPWLVAAATLAAAALFGPARRRVQVAVDRRFNRRRYDAARTIETFSARLREHVDLDTISAELLGLVDVVMEPTAASLWLRAR